MRLPKELVQEQSPADFCYPAPSEGAGVYQEFTASLSALPALNEGTLAAAIWIGAPVWGLRPVRAGRSLTLKEPKPTSDTELPDFNDAAIASVMASIARAAAALVNRQLQQQRQLILIYSRYPLLMIVGSS